MAVVDTRIPLSRKSLDTASPLFRLSQQQRQRELDEERRNNRAEDVEFRNKRAEVDDTFRQQGMDLRREEFESNKGFKNRSLGIQERNASLNRELKNLQIANEKINNLNAREQSRMNSVIQGGAELGIFLENGDMAGAEQYLLKRKASIGRMISEGQDIDTTDTDAALLAIRSGDEAQIQKLKQTTNNLRDIGVIRGLIKAEQGGGIGGATGELANRLIEEGSANTVADALLLIKGGFNKGLTIGDDGNLTTREGLTDSLAEIKGAEQFGRDTGATQAEREANIGKVEQQASFMIDTIDKLITNDGKLQDGVGSVTGGLLGMQGRQSSVLPLSESQRKFQPVIEQLKGQTFLDAYERLKGGGVITEIEGAKAEQALARLNQAQSDGDFAAALKDLRDVVNVGLIRSREEAGKTTQNSNNQVIDFSELPE